MAQSPSETSSQNSINVFTSVSANTILHIEDESGNELITFAPNKSAESIVISSPNIKNGPTYNVYTGGESTGTSTDGLYSEGSYSGGTKGDSFTVSITVTNVDENSGGFRGPGGGNMPGQRGEMPSRP